jgi:hypothetical protein
MADWILIACLKQLFAEFNLIAPNRDHASDGSIGDIAHQHEVSDHNPDETGSVPIHDADHINEVHAIDVDVDLNEPGLNMEMVVQFVLARCRSGAENRLRYIIYNRRIWEADNGWRQRAYTGANAHTEHAHFSASYDTPKEASTASWHLEDIPVALTASDKTEIRAIFADELAKIIAMTPQPDKTPTSKAGQATWDQGIPDGTIASNPRRYAYTVLQNLGKLLTEVHDDVRQLLPPPATTKAE